MVSRLNTIIGILFVTFLMGPFNNCAPLSSGTSSGQQSGIAKTGGGNYNGGGFSGKVQYVYYAPEASCSQNPTTPESLIDFDSSKISVTENKCGSSHTRDISLSQLIINPYNPYYLVFDEKVFVEPSITVTDNPNYRVVIHAFCYNQSYQEPLLSSTGLDFAVRIEQEWNGQWDTKTYGHAIYGLNSGVPLNEEETGKLKEVAGTPSDIAPFISESGKYRLDFGQKVTPYQGPGVLTISGVKKVPMSCHFLHLKSTVK